MSKEIIEQPKKKRGRPKKIDLIHEITEQPKKKRGRPKKIDPFADYNEIIINTFNGYLTVYNNLLNDFINSEERIIKEIWDKIYNHVKQINEVLGKNTPEYNYKINSQWKLIDNIRENMRKDYIKDIIDKKEIEDPLKSVLVFNHLSVYIAESSKEMKG